MSAEVRDDALVVSEKKLMEFGIEYTEYLILDSRPPGFVRFQSSVLDSDGIRWAAAWVQTGPDKLEAFAWSTDPFRHLRKRMSKGTAATGARIISEE